MHEHRPLPGLSVFSYILETTWASFFPRPRLASSSWVPRTPRGKGPIPRSVLTSSTSSRMRECSPSMFNHCVRQPSLSYIDSNQCLLYLQKKCIWQGRTTYARTSSSQVSTACRTCHGTGTPTRSPQERSGDTASIGHPSSPLGTGSTPSPSRYVNARPDASP